MTSTPDPSQEPEQPPPPRPERRPQGQQTPAERRRNRSPAGDQQARSQPPPRLDQTILPRRPDPRRAQPEPRQQRPERPRPQRNGSSIGEINLKVVALAAFIFGVALHGCVAMSFLGDEGEAELEPDATIEILAPTSTVVAPTETVLPDRTSCDEIRGTPYRSDAERDFFRTNCL